MSSFPPARRLVPGFLAALAILVAGAAPASPADDKVTSFTDPLGIRVHVSAPANPDPKLPTRLIFYALPNGNTLEWTLGKEVKPGDDWHFAIQQIAAQTRRLRELDPGHNIVVACVEAEGRSWPAWRKKRPDNGRQLRGFVESVRARFAPGATAELSGHSGGGSMLFGYLEGGATIPTTVTRLAWLDANYAWNSADHGTTLSAWLRASRQHCLFVAAYDDRNIELNGKKVVGPDGGTWRRTERMLARLRADFDIRQTTEGRVMRFTALEGRLDIRMVPNPENKILHTVLVEKNGFVAAMLSGTPPAAKSDPFFGEAGYRRWIAK